MWRRWKKERNELLLQRKRKHERMNKRSKKRWRPTKTTDAQQNVKCVERDRAIENIKKKLCRQLFCILSLLLHFISRSLGCFARVSMFIVWCAMFMCVCVCYWRLSSMHFCSMHLLSTHIFVQMSERFFFVWPSAKKKSIFICVYVYRGRAHRIIYICDIYIFVGMLFLLALL